MNIPQHIAIIMDGNGRWAQERGLSRAAGHEAGAEALARLIEEVAESGISWLTFFAFSSENWRRPSSEIKDLFALLRQFVESHLSVITKANIRIRIIGDRAELDPDIDELLSKSEQLTVNNTGLVVVIAFNYGGRNDILRATKKICQKVVAGELDAAGLSAEVFSQHLDTHFMPDPDLIIRTSGEMRLSNFLLWQSAYAEFFFARCYWPEFSKEKLSEALDAYRERKRRFGAI